MFGDFDPKEKKVIIIFLALLMLVLIYVGTHNLQLGVQDHPSANPIPVEDVSSSGRYL